MGTSPVITDADIYIPGSYICGQCDEKFANFAENYPNIVLCPHDGTPLRRETYRGAFTKLTEEIKVVANEKSCTNCLFAQTTEDTDRMLVCSNSDVLISQRTRHGSHFRPACSYETAYGTECGRERKLFQSKLQTEWPKRTTVFLHGDPLSMMAKATELQLEIGDGSCDNFIVSFMQISVDIEVYNNGQVKIRKVNLLLE